MRCVGVDFLNRQVDGDAGVGLQGGTQAPTAPDDDSIDKRFGFVTQHGIDRLFGGECRDSWVKLDAEVRSLSCWS